MLDTERKFSYTTILTKSVFLILGAGKVTFFFSQKCREECEQSTVDSHQHKY